MGTVKNAIYQVDNGTDFDEIHFKTNASQVQIQDINNRFSSSDVEGALNELFQYANNGKNTIAASIGSPLLASDTFVAMGTKISSIKSSLAAAITNKGVSTGSGDTFAAMTSKISQINTGKRWASGTSTTSNGYGTVSGLAFTPTMVVMHISNPGYTNGEQLLCHSPIVQFSIENKAPVNVDDNTLNRTWWQSGISITSGGFSGKPPGGSAGTGLVFKWYAVE